MLQNRFSDSWDDRHNWDERSSQRHHSRREGRHRQHESGEQRVKRGVDSRVHVDTWMDNRKRKREGRYEEHDTIPKIIRLSESEVDVPDPISL